MFATSTAFIRNNYLVVTKINKIIPFIVGFYKFFCSTNNGIRSWTWYAIANKDPSRNY